MPRSKSPPRVKGPYAERGGARFRIRICDSTGHRDVYFSTLNEAQAGIRQATREVLQSGGRRRQHLQMDGPRSSADVELLHQLEQRRAVHL